MTAHRLQALFEPRSIAVYGVSADPGKLGSVMAASLANYPAPILGLNPRNPNKELGIYADIPSAKRAHGTGDTPVDLAVLCVPAAATANALEDAAANGVTTALVCAGGFGEAGEVGVANEKAIREVAARTEILVLGPNTSGFLRPAGGLFASFVPGTPSIRPGGISIVASSGGVQHALAFLLQEAGYGLHLGVGLGAGWSVSAASVLDYLAVEGTSDAVGLYLESVEDGQALLQAVSDLRSSTPIVALVVGSPEVHDFAASHTGSLASSLEATRAALRQRGVLVVDTERQLIDSLGALSTRASGHGGQRNDTRPQAQGPQDVQSTKPGVGLVTGQAGPGLLILEALSEGNVRVPPLAETTRSILSGLLGDLTFQENPVDTGRPSDSFGAVLRSVGSDPAVDILGIYGIYEPGALDFEEALAQVDRQDLATVIGIGGAGDQARALRTRLIDAGFAATTDPTGVANGLKALVHDAQWQSGRSLVGAQPPPLAGSSQAPSQLDPSLQDAALHCEPIDEHAGKVILAKLGLSIPRGHRCVNEAEASAALAELAGPVAVKALSPLLLHKTEVSGLRLNVSTPQQVKLAYTQMAGVPESAGLVSSGVLVERMSEPGLDLVLSAYQDEVFGPMILLGLGGTAAEAIGDVALCPAPLSPKDLSIMIDSLAGRALLRGYRGAPPVEEQFLLQHANDLAAHLVMHPNLRVIEINPLRLVQDSLVALDAVFELKEQQHG